MKNEKLKMKLEMLRKSFFVFLIIVSPLIAYFENIPQKFEETLSATVYANPARLSQKKNLYFLYASPYQGFDESFSASIAGISACLKKLSFDLNYRSFSSGSFYKETLAEVRAGKEFSKFSFGMGLKMYGFKFSLDEYTKSDPYFTKTSDNALSLDIGILKTIKNKEFSFLITNFYSTGAGIKKPETLNKKLSAGFKTPILTMNTDFFAELGMNTSDVYEKIDYAAGIDFLFAPVNLIFSVSQNFFTSSFKIKLGNLLENYLVSMGIAMKIPQGTSNNLKSTYFSFSIYEKSEEEKVHEQKTKEQKKEKRMRKSQQKREINTLLRDANRNFRRGNLSQAEEICHKILEMDAKNKKAKKLLKMIGKKKNEKK